MTFDEEMRAVALEVLQGETGNDAIGFAGVVTRPGTSILNKTTLRTEETGSLFISVVAAFVEPPDARQYESELSQEQMTERKWMVIVPTEAGEPLAGDILVAEGRSIKLEGVNPIGPKRNAIYYRAYAER